MAMSLAALLVGAGNGVARADGAPTLGPTAAPILALRYHATDQSSVYVDAVRGRRLGLEFEDRIVGKVGVEFRAAQSDWQIAYGGLGFRLAGDARLTLKLRRGGLSVVMQSAF